MMYLKIGMKLVSNFHSLSSQVYYVREQRYYTAAAKLYENEDCMLLAAAHAGGPSTAR